MTEAPPVVVVGAGLAGAVTACYLARAGCRVDVCEKRSDPRPGGADHGRSINLALSTRGLHALREIGLAEEVLKSAVLMRGRMIHSPSGQLAFQPYGKDDSEALHSVSRAGLNRLLLEAAARYETVRLFFGRRCTGLTADAAAVEFADGPPVEAAAVIGADGAYSAVRGWMQRQDRFDYRQDYLSHGYKELTIPAGPGGAHHMEKHALHIWPRGRYMLIALPNLDGSFTCTLFAPFDGPDGLAALTTEADVEAYFRERFPDAAPLMPDLARDFFGNPTGSLVTIRCQPWRVGRAVLVGDACHAVVPFLGQGMNAAFEDCTVLHECLQYHSGHWPHAAADYERRRKRHADALADLCVENYREMRDRTASPLFVLQKKTAILLHRLFPRWYLPLYTMVEFTRIPYADAVRRAQTQDRIVWAVALGFLALLAAAVGALLMR